MAHHSPSGYENGMLNIGGCINFPEPIIETSDFTLSHNYIHLVNPTNENVNVTLPPPALCPGRIYLVKNISTNASKKVTLIGPINGGNNHQLFFGDSIRIMSIPELERYETL